MGNTIDRQIRHISLGEKSKLKIATALLCNPKGNYLLLDEPSVGLDPWNQ